MRYLSVCSGIEAATVAWHPLGWTPAGLSEIDPFPRAVLQKRLGALPVDWDHRYSPKSNVLPLFGDFTQIQEHHVGPVDLLVGGTPCQSFSVAGKRLGLDDPRGNLAIEFLALAKRVRARWLAWENVPGVLSSWSGDAAGEGDVDTGEREYDETGDLHAFLELFRECGYRGCYRVLDAQYVRVDGLGRAVPQRRRRLFVVGHLGDDSRASAVLFDRQSLRGDPAPRRQPGQGFARDTVPSLTGSSVGARRAGESRGQDPDIAERKGQWWDGSDVSQTLDAVLSKGQMMPEKNRFPCILEPISFPEFMSGTQDVAEHPTSNALQATNPTAVAFSCKDHGADAGEGISPTMRAMGHGETHPNGGGQLAVAFKAGHFTRGKDGAPSDVAFSLSADADMGDQDNLILAPVAFDETQLTHPANHSSPKPGDPCHPLASGARPPAIAFQERGREGGRSVETQDDVAYALTSPEGGGRRNEINVAFAFQSRIARNDRGQPEDICPTLNGADAGTTSDMRPIAAIQAQSPNPEANTFSGATDGWVVRRLTVRECERLQGFPDDWTLIPYGSRTKMEPDMFAYLKASYPDLTLDEAEKLAADAPRYKSIGNSMAVNVMRWIGRRIDYVERLVGAD